jgi:hypothetical protein
MKLPQNPSESPLIISQLIFEVATPLLKRNNIPIIIEPDILAAKVPHGKDFFIALYLDKYHLVRVP